MKGTHSFTQPCGLQGLHSIKQVPKNNAVRPPAGGLQEVGCGAASGFCACAAARAG